METTVATPAPFADRRRPYAVAPRGADFVGGGPPCVSRDVDDLTDADLRGRPGRPDAVRRQRRAGGRDRRGAGRADRRDRPGRLAHDLSPEAQTFAA